MEFHLKNVTPEEMVQLFPHQQILVAYRGSIAHNMYVPASDPESIDDKDIMSVCIPSIEYYFGLQHFEGKDTFIREYDVVVYELQKFVRLLTNSNPNVLSLLWLEPHHYIYKNHFGQALIEKRQLFMTKRLHKSFTGYAYGQLKKMTHNNFNGYMGEKRKQLVEKFGYDCKNASHGIRLLKMGCEALVTGELEVSRHDAPQLLEIKRGLWSLEQVQKEAERLFQRAEANFDKCTLPLHPDYDKINALLVDVLRNYFH